MKKIYLLLIAALIGGGNLFAQLYGQSFGQTGLVDVEFGSNGMITNSYDVTANMNGHTSVLQPNGNIIMAGGNGSNTVTLVRYTAYGNPDNGFGTGGKVIITAPAGNTLGSTSAASLAVQADGKIIYASNASGKIALVRLKVSGTFDSTFGTNGISYSPAVASWGSTVGKVILKPDGKILTAGTGYYNVNTPYFEVAQFLSNGKLDSSFAVNGFFHYSAGPGGAGHSLVLLPNDHIIVAGIRYPLGVMAGVNLKPNGVIDSSYGTNGVITCQAFLNNKALYCRVALQNDNKVLLLGGGIWTGNRKAIGLGRFFVNGKPDTAFAYLGTLTTTFEGFSDFPQSVSEQFDGTLVVGGYSTLSGNKFAMMRLKSNGSTDTTYGRLGKVLTAIPGTTGVVESSFMQPDGKLVLTGSTKLNNVYSFVAARFVVTPNPHYNTLKGYCYLDLNSNGVQDAGEPLSSNVKFTIIKPNLDSITVLSSDGSFLVDVLDTGTYVSNAILPNSIPYSSTPSPANHMTSNSTYFNTDSIIFSTHPLPGITDVGISLTLTHGVRPWFWTSYELDYKNHGTTVANGTVIFIKSPKLTLTNNWFNTTPAPTSISGDTLRWDYANLLPNDTRSISVYLGTPTNLNIGDTVNAVAIVTTILPDSYMPNNTASLVNLVQNSYDPNDKKEGHAGKINVAKVAAGEYLNYTIRFQNTGTADAINVFLRDTLSSKLDWSTLEMTSASHNYQMTMNDGKCLWAFNNINLADSNTNEPASHGYISYRIKPKANVQVGDVIKNTAAIFFDYNLPIYTNTETTTITTDALPLRLLSFTARKENKNNLLNWSTSSEINVDRFEVERSSNGREFGKIGMVRAGNTTYSFTDNNPFASPLSNTVGKGSGVRYYRLKMIDIDGHFTYSPVRMISNNSSYFVSIYPNPAKDNLQVQIYSDKKAALQLIVLSADGKVMLSKSIKASEGGNLRSINISTLPRGSYLLKVNSDNVEQVIKFEKL